MKRLNPHRRLLARQAALKACVQSQGAAADAWFQQGRVRSSLNPRVQRKTMIPPHFVPLPDVPTKALKAKVHLR